MGKKVLIVDDEEAIVEFMNDVFARKGCNVLKAMDSQEALMIFENEKPDICILDVHMPFSQFDGIELLRQIKQKNKDATCVIISRVDDKSKIEEAEKLGVKNYIFKPIDFENLKNLINSLLQ